MQTQLSSYRYIAVCIMAENPRIGIKRKHSVTSFQKEWSKMWPCIQPVRQYPDKAFCAVCSSSFSIVHQGKRDVERHIKGSEHKRLSGIVNSCQTLTKFLPDRKSQDKVINAEVLFTGYILEHNLPFESAAHAGPLFRKMFPDSDIARKYGCASTKTAAIINYAMAPFLHDSLVEYLQQNPFSLAIDGSSDTGTNSMYPLLVRVYDGNRGEICSKFWRMCLVSDSSADGIFAQVSRAFEEESVPWDNVVGLSLDNASVNMGRHNGLYRKFEAKNKCVYTLGCPCHIIHNTANFASRSFSRVTGFDIGDFLVDIYYYFDNSTKRQALLKEYCTFCDQEYRKILKFGATRWLSKEICITRVLRQFPSLKSYFASQPELRSDPRLRRLQAYFSDPLTEIYLLFLQSVMPLFTDINKTLQSDEPKLFILHKHMQQFLRKLLGRFVKAEALATTSVKSVDMEDDAVLLSLDKVMIGFSTRSTMNSNDLHHEREKVARNCRVFMIEAYKYAIAHLPLHDPVLQHAEVLQHECRTTAEFDSLLFFVEKYPTLKLKLEASIDKLYDQFSDYQALDDTAFTGFNRVDHLWHALSTLQGCSGPRFNLLFEVAKYILLLPHSNAEEERIFSTVTKNKTKFRASLSNEKSLPSILTCKTNCFNHLHCFDFEPSTILLDKAKKAATTYNIDHSQPGCSSSS